MDKTQPNLEGCSDIVLIPKFDAVVLSGGGIKGLLTLGALHYHYMKGDFDMKYVHTYVGTSIGSDINLLLVCGYTPLEIFIKIYEIENFFDVTDCNNIWDMSTFMGLMDINNFMSKIEKMVENVFGCVPTLQELYNMTQKFGSSFTSQIYM
jgi:patatin-like phospholipase/acyl hydrolase